MREKVVLVQGATLQCKFSEQPKVDILIVKSQSKHFANDKGAEKKLIATTKETGQTLEKNTFGNCKLQPTGSSYKICQAVIAQWSSSYEKITLSNQGKILIEDSKATCPIGGTDCISVVKHGQKAELGKQNVKNARAMLSNQINPLVDMSLFQAEIEEEDVE